MMTEMEKVKYAKEFIDKLADGINPLDGTAVPETDLLSNVRITRCMFYVSDILRQVIDNNGVRKTVNSKRIQFYLTPEQQVKFETSDTPLSVSELTKYLNSLTEENQCKQLSYKKITDWLIGIGAIQDEIQDDGKRVKTVTEVGSSIGIFTESRNGYYGIYSVVLYNSNAQQFIFDNLDAILATEKTAFN